jgi:tetratricopeptide (TPR) repeat protein
MRILIFALCSAIMLTSVPVWTQGLDRERAVQALSESDPQTRRDAAARLGEVGTMADVAELARALHDPDADARERAEQALWQIWARSGDAEIDRLYAKGVEQMNAGELEQGIVTFTRIIERKPDFAEGWNKRATLYFLNDEPLKSLADCDEVMKRNPYHFGALSGYALIYMRLERYELALEYSRKALAVNPNLDGVKRNIELLEPLVEQRRKRMI